MNKCYIQRVYAAEMYRQTKMLLLRDIFAEYSEFSIPIGSSTRGFGGFLTMNSTGEITYLAIVMMFLGLLTGILGIAMSSGSRHENPAEQ